MNSASDNRRYLPFYYKLLLLFLLFVSLTVSVAGFVSFRFFVQTIEQDARKNVAATLEQMSDNIAYKADTVLRISNQVYEDQEMQRFLTMTDKRRIYQTYSQYVRPMLSFHSTSNDLEAIRIVLYSSNPSIPEVYRTLGAGNTPLLEKNYDMLRLERVKNELWLRELGSGGRKVRWIEIGTDRQSANLSLTRLLLQFEEIPFPVIGALQITVKAQELFQAVDSRALGVGAGLFVLPLRGGNPLYKSAANEWETYAGHASSYHQLEEPLPGLDARLVAFIPKERFDRTAASVRGSIIAVCAVGFVLFAIAGLLFSHTVSRRVNKIVTVLNAFRQGDFYKRIPDTGRDEIGQIGSSFNTMAEELKGLIDEVYLKDLQKKELELELLQSQINPHFLYNTLSSISRLGKMGDNDRLHAMVMELAKFYRLTLNKGKTLTSVRNELEHAGAYMEIQKMKYGDLIHCEWSIDPDAMRYDTVKLILQPFLENVLEHAWLKDRLLIRIGASLVKDRIVFTIQDDGKGMEQEVMAQILHPSGEKIGYGIRNVNERIKLQFGQEYGIALQGMPGEGLKVEITVPAYRETET